MVRGAEAVLERLRTLGLTRFIRVKEEVNKDAMLADPDAARAVDGVTIVQAEEFAIEPHNVELAAAQ